MMPLSVRVGSIVAVPAGAAIAMFFLTASEDGPSAGRLFRSGLGFVIVGLLLAWDAWNSHRIRNLELELEVSKRVTVGSVKKLRASVQDLRDDVARTKALTERRLMELEHRDPSDPLHKMVFGNGEDRWPGDRA
ncbi:hypothetical protein [Actinophytocola sp.]|uniref:hypothetical protein n=1 Tax=Actinophytocola sp. TaxID=1872138 RepID=UPI002D37CB4F|nr:hypothetical protein [Actinophytocola sp.]HYQ69668.1 hypothetical protein [Actinophytocola sp.]